MDEENNPNDKIPIKNSSPVASVAISKVSDTIEVVDNLKIASPSFTSEQQIKTPDKLSQSNKRPGSPTKNSIDISFKSMKSRSSVCPEKDAEVMNKKSVNQNEATTKENIIESLSNIEPRGKMIGDQVDELTESIRELSKNLETSGSPVIHSNINKIANMSKTLTDEAEALRESIKSLSRDLYLTKQELCPEKKEDVNFPYHLFLIELIINSINMKCECFELDYNSLVISASFLGKQPIRLYDTSYGKIDDLKHLNIGKSALFAMTYDKICSIKEFNIEIELTKQPPCSNCVAKIAEANMDYSKEFIKLREELCKKWTNEQPQDNILCTTSTPLKKNMYYLMHSGEVVCEPIGVMEITVRMSFLGKEITTTFCASSKNKCTLAKDDNGVSMYSCHDVEMDVQGNVVLNEEVITKKRYSRTVISKNGISSSSSDRTIAMLTNQNKYTTRQMNKYIDEIPKYNEIFTKMNANELKIRVPKATKIERAGKYDKIQELCSCDSTAYNTGEQIQFELPKDLCNPDKTHNTYSSNLKYTYKGCDYVCEPKNRKIINVTPSNCPAPVNMEKVVHPNKDVFILKIGKKLETQDKKTELEIELVTPKSPTEKPVENNNISQQCSSSNIKEHKSKDKKEQKKRKKNKDQVSKKKSKSQLAGKQKKSKK